MIDFHCWCQNISKEEYLKILNKSSICCENDCQYKEDIRELFIQINQTKLQNEHVDDIFKDLEGILERKLECHINIQDEIKGLKLSVIQKNGWKSIKNKI